jgi:prophage DNA circulation protein
MINTDSRYANGTLFSAYINVDASYHATVFRRFPSHSSRYSIYTWAENDRIDLVAYKFYRDASSWWQIMDYNPEIVNPFDIPVGTSIRIPNV